MDEVDMVVLDSFDSLPEAFLLFSTGDILLRIEDSRALLMVGGSGSEVNDDGIEEE